MNRRRVVWWGVAGVAVVALGVFLVVDEWIPGPKPRFSEDSGVVGRWQQGSIEPLWEDAEPHVTAWEVRRDWVDFLVEEEPRSEWGVIRVGESATLAGVTITLCDTWVNKWAYVGWRLDSGWTADDPSRAYYVVSTDGSIPTCP